MYIGRRVIDPAQTELLNQSQQTNYLNSAYYFIELDNHKPVSVQLEVACDISTYCQYLTGGEAKIFTGGLAPKCLPLGYGPEHNGYPVTRPIQIS